MITYLDIYNTWGDVYLEVSYYLKENGVELENKTNFILSNFKYLQSGVDDDQWSLITQRITNFGNSKCKQLLVSNLITFIFLCPKLLVLFFSIP